MPWPQPTDYNAAMQNPALSLTDPELRQARVVTNALGLPSLHSGNFADVYQLRGADGQSWAVKCFTREVPGLALRYRSVSEHLRRVRRPFLVDFTWLEQGVRVRGEWFPVLKMRWVEGLTLNQFVEEYLGHGTALNQLASLWLKLARELRDAHLGHGDLQHGNVLLVPGKHETSLALRLIDYDGMWVPELAGKPSGEVGHPNYQHPQRLRDGGYGPEVDRFALLAVYTALRAMTASGKALWKKYDSGENLLFREADFHDPSRSKLLLELAGHADPAVRALAGHLLVALRRPPEETPRLDEIIDDGAVVRPLSAIEEAHVRALLPAMPAQAAPAPLVLDLPAPLATTAVVAPAPAVPPPLPIVAILPLVEPRGAPPPLPVVVPAAPPLPVYPAFPAPGRAAAQGFPRRSLFVAVALSLMLGGGLVAAVTVLVVVIAGARPDGETQKRGNQEGQPPRLAPLDPLTLTAGDSGEVVVWIDRGDCHEPLDVAVENLPAEVRCEGVTVPADERTIVLQLHLDPRTRPGTYAARVTLWSASRKMDTRDLALSVEKLPLPAMRPPGPLTLSAGVRHNIDVEVDRQGCEKPLRLEIAGLPDEIHSDVTALAGQTVFRLHLLAQPDAPPGPNLVKLTLYAGPYKAQQELWNVRVKKGEGPKSNPDATPRITGAATEPWEAGKRASLLVKLDRQGYEGKLEVGIIKAPFWLKEAGAATVAEGESECRLPVRVSETAFPGRYPLQLEARAGQRSSPAYTTYVVVQVRRPVFRARPTTVTLTTVDQVTLTGTLYPGEGIAHKGCVLLLHELGGSRSAPEIVRLAEALQKAGHDVFTFDFRGHGDSTRVFPSIFWAQHANQGLKGFKKGVVFAKQSETISKDDMDTSYHPWLVNDLAAARLELDRLGDSGKVQPGSLVVIGAGESATLGAMWMLSEHWRYQAITLARPGAPARWNTEPEGRELAGAVWLNPASAFGRQAVNLDDWLRRTTSKSYRPPMVFLCGAGDEAAVKLATQHVERLKSSGHKQAEVLTIKDADQAGQKLLREDLETEKVIVERVGKMLAAHTPKESVAVAGTRSLYAYQVGTKLVPQQNNGLLLATVPLSSLGIGWLGK
jgi:pimeloyl-ACP methyl ester carboxylesterase